MPYEDTRVRIVDEDGQVARVPKNRVDRYVEIGWTVADDGSSEEAEPEPAPAKKTAAKKTTSKEG